MQDPRYAFATRMLSGIMVTVRTNRHATDAQAEAVQNVDNAVENR